MKRPRRNLGTGIAFLDVMACGLGAVVLLFLIVKHNTDAAIQQAEDDLISSSEMMLESLLIEKADLESKIEAKTVEHEQRQQQMKEQQTLKEEQAEKEKELSELVNRIHQNQIRKRSLEREIVALQPKQATDIVEVQQVAEEHYLLGMRVEGRRIAILIDRSASMTDEKLIQVISRKFRSDQEKMAGPKWKRTVRTAKWLLNRLPADSEFVVVLFNEKATVLNNGNWASSRDEKKVQQAFDEFDSTVPTGGTNLEAGLRAISSLSKSATNVYVVTDGLPTKSISSAGLFSGCKNAEIVSGGCRRRMFEVSVSTFTRSKVNVVLLPLEGDPEAAPAYWAWTATTGGLTLVPPANWP